MKQEEAAAFTEKCFNGEPASCSFACPYSLDIRSFLEKAEKGRWNAAYKTLRNAVVFPAIACSLCPAPCENSCQRTATGDEPIAMGFIEDACIRYAKNKKPDSYVIPPKNEKIAIVGAGLAGLTGALNLAQKKYKVTVFDKNPGWGGALRDDPRFEEFDADIRLQFSAAETEFKFNTEIKTLDELSDFNAVYLATGSGGEDFGLLPGWDENLLTTETPRVFLGGALTGADTAGCITQGLRLSKTVEVFLQTGKASATYGESGDKKNCSRHVDHTGVPSVTRVKPSGDDGYTDEEARAEAARCMKCDCTKCLNACEMLSSFRKKPKKISVEVFTDTQVNPPYSSHTLTRQAYSCNMCGHCKNVCPEDCDIGSLLQMSRTARAQESVYPEALHDYWLREMDFSTGEASFYALPEGKCEYLFFPGCQLGAANPEFVFRSYEHLAENYNAGIYVGCCGAPAYWAGDTGRQEKNFEDIRTTAAEMGNPKFVFACATCESVFEKFLPEIQRVSLYELLADSSEIIPAAVYENACVFDPCNARKNPEMENAVRGLAKKSGTHLSDLPEKNRCCGWGGHMRLGNPELYDKITANRAGMDENPYIVYCVNCREVFLQRGKPCIHILDMAFSLPPAGQAPKIEEKRKNSLRVKRELLKRMKNEDFIPGVNEWDSLELIVPDTLAEDIDRRLISQSEIKEAIWLAESDGDYFLDEENGVFRCSMEKPVLTYWVTYKKTGGGYEILEAYCHRMRFSREDA